jgi:hypothetical protein
MRYVHLHEFEIVFGIETSTVTGAPWSGAKVTVPALYFAGEQDLVVKLAYRQPQTICSPTPKDDHFSRLRALDAAGEG